MTASHDPLDELSPQSSASVPARERAQTALSDLTFTLTRVPLLEVPPPGPHSRLPIAMRAFTIFLSGAGRWAAVPLVLAMGLGLGNAVSAVEGFGILSMASIGPIIAVLSMGLFIRFRQSRAVAANAK